MRIKKASRWRRSESGPRSGGRANAWCAREAIAATPQALYALGVPKPFGLADGVALLIAMAAAAALIAGRR